MMTTQEVKDRQMCDDGPCALQAEDENTGVPPGSRIASPCRDAEVAEAVHDFRNILASVSMLCELMAAELPEDSPIQEFGHDVRTACNDAQALCEQMLVSSRSLCESAGQTDLTHVVTRMVPLLSRFVPPTVTLRLDLATGLPPLRFAPAALRRILVNLVKNAAEALGDWPGAIVITTSWTDLGTADSHTGNGHAAQRLGRHVCLAVSDTGRGMDEPARASLMEHGLTTKANGHGLGFASVRRIAAAQGADVQLESQPGVGTTVRVIFGRDTTSA